MPFVLPTFNVSCGIWRSTNPTSNPPDVVALGNLSPGRIIGTDTAPTPTSELGQGGMWLRLPANTDVQDDGNGVGADVVECPHTSGRFYTAVWVDDIGGGFSNEHRFAYLQKLGPWPTPFPGVGSFTPIVPPPPPAHLTDFTTGNALVVYVSSGTQTSTGEVLGWLLVVNNPSLPIIQVNSLGPNYVLTGAGSFAGPFLTPSGTAYLYAFKMPALTAAGITVVMTGGGSFYASCLVYDVGRSIATPTLEGATTGSGSFGSTPSYPTNPAHPWVHLSCVATGPSTALFWTAPWSVLHLAYPQTFGLGTTSMFVGQYETLVGGNPQSIWTTISPTAWGALQIGYHG